MGHDPQFENPLKRKLPLIIVFEMASRTHAHSDLPSHLTQLPLQGGPQPGLARVCGTSSGSHLPAGDQGLSVMVREGGDARREGIRDEGIFCPARMRTENQLQFSELVPSYVFLFFVYGICTLDKDKSK